MRILWVTNVKLPIIYKLQNKENKINAGGWLDQISKGIISDPQNVLCVCYPYDESESGQYGNLQYHSLVFNQVKMRCGRLKREEHYEKITKIVKSFSPDVVHIHGTEFQYSWFFTEACKSLGLLDKTIISIQGMVSIYAKHFLQGIPEKVQHKHTVRELLSHSNIYDSYMNFVIRGKYEELAIKNAKNVMGRTTWDQACTYLINPKVKYHFCNETLRSEFYKDRWKVENCNKHTIFISQASYPIKGFHKFLEALVQVKTFYPDVSVRIAGVDLSKSDCIKGSSYAEYIKKNILKLKLQKQVSFLGSLNAEEMKKEMLSCNVFVSPSNIENSPNSIGEAMLLGVPVVSSDVGGVKDLMEHNKEGFVYSYDATYMLAYYIMQIFKDKELAKCMGENAHMRAMCTHDYETNLKTLLDVYMQLIRRN